jgi:hypothetical protein
MFRWLGFLGMLWSSRTIWVLSLGKSRTSIVAMFLLFSSMWSRSTCPIGFAGSSKEFQAAHRRFTQPTKNCMGALSIHNKAIIVMCVLELAIILLQVWAQEEVQGEGLARNTLRVHPVGSATRLAHLWWVPLLASLVYEDTYQAPYTDDAIDDDSEEDVIEDVNNAATRGETQPKRAPL